MATYLNVDFVKYLCSCERKVSYFFLYFCRHCLKLRCPSCVSQEVDTIFCPSCLEGMITAEAMAKKNRCNNCFECPCCQHTLSTRATTQLSSSTILDITLNESTISGTPTDGKTSKKVYYLACGFCRWTSRDAGIPDQTEASGGWQTYQNPDQKRLGSVLDYYQQLDLREQAEKEKRKVQSKKRAAGASAFMFNTPDKYGLSSVAFRFRSMNSPVTYKESDLENAAKVAVSQAREEPETGGEGNDSSYFEDSLEPGSARDGSSLYAAPHDFSRVLDLHQRFLVPECQVATPDCLLPQRKLLVAKMSKRCKECEHNLIKPEFNPASVKFKIHQVAYSYVPAVAVKSVATPLTPGKVALVTLTVTNPLQYKMSFRLAQSNQETCLAEATGRVEGLSEEELVLPAKDEAAMFDTAAYEDPKISSDLDPDCGKADPACVMFRKANKMGVAVRVVPQPCHTTTPTGGRGLLETTPTQFNDVIVPLAIRYTFSSALSQFSHTQGAGDASQKHPEVTWLEQHLLLNVGSCGGGGGQAVNDPLGATVH